MEWLIILGVMITFVVVSMSRDEKNRNDVFERINTRQENAQRFANSMFRNDKYAYNKFLYLDQDYNPNSILSLNEQVLEKAETKNAGFYNGSAINDLGNWIYEDDSMIKTIINLTPQYFNKLELDKYRSKLPNSIFHYYNYYLEYYIKNNFKFSVIKVPEYPYEEAKEFAIKAVGYTPEFYEKLPERLKGDKDVFRAFTGNTAKIRGNKEKVIQVVVFENKNVAITGKLVKFNKADLISLIVSSKGKYVNSIDKTTNILVVGENPGNKLDLAKQLDLIIIKEADLI